jgi:ABC-type multidrug transport system permease subunit
VSPNSLAFSIPTDFPVYFKIDKTAVGIQALSLAQIIIAQSAPVIMIDIAFFYQDQFSLFIARERNGVFGWHALVTSLLITDIPSTMLVYILSFLCYFWSLGVDTSAPAGGLEL